MTHLYKQTILLIGLLLLYSIPLVAQEKAKYGFDLKYYLTTVSENTMVPLLVEGDQHQVGEVVLKHGGKVRLQVQELFSIEVPASAVPNFAKEEAVHLIEFSLAEGKTLADTMLINVNADSVMKQYAPLRSKYRGKGVILGVIDSGIELDHPDFQDSTGKTRVLYVWDQGVTYDPSRQAENYLYGIEWDSSAINSGASTHDDKANEFGHGSNVTGAAASNGLAKGNIKGVAPEVHIISVATDFRKPNWLQTIAEAVDYIYTKADSMNMPCVINASVGTYIGSHDGLDISARIIDRKIKEKEGRAFVCAAGNAAQIPFHLRQEPNNDTVFTWFESNAAQHSGLGGLYFEVWSDSIDFDDVKFAIGADREVSNNFEFRGRTVFDSISTRLNVIYRDSIIGHSGKVLARIETYAEKSQGRYKLEVAMVDPDSSDYLFRFETIGSGKLDIWASRSLFRHSDMRKVNLPSVANYPSIANYKKPDTLQTMVSSFTCLPSAITVGNYINRNTYTDVTGIKRTMGVIPGSISPNSSLGPNRQDYTKPDVSSAGDFMFAAGRLATIKSQITSSPQKVSQDSLHFRNGGTSMASPTVAGMVALYLEQCPKADHQQIKDDLIATAKADTYAHSLPNYTWGAGKADAFAYLKKRVFSPQLNPLPLPEFCVGDTISLSANNTSYTYTWNIGNDSTTAINVSESGIFYATALNTNGCLSPTDTIDLTFKPKPTAPNLIRRNDSLIFPVNGKLQWYNLSGRIMGETDSIFEVNSSGDYYCVLSDTNGCSANSDTLKVIITSLRNLSQKEFLLYPNPSSGIVKIEFSENANIEHLQLYSIRGKIVWQMNDINVRQPLEVNWGQLNKGIYWLQWNNQRKRQVEKILIQ